MDGCQINQYSNVSKHLRNMSQIAADTQNNAFTYSPDNGSANAYSIHPQPAIAAYAAGQKFAFKAANANSGSSTLNVSDLGARTIIKNGSPVLTSGDIVTGQIIEVTYDGTNFQMPNISSSGGGGGGMTNPMNTLGDMMYGGTSGAPTRLAGDTSNTRKFLREQSSSGVAAAPVWDTLQGGDLPFPVLGYQNLKIRNNPTTPATKIDISADYAALFNANVSFVAASPSVTIDFSTTGANALDTGSVANGNWYYFWLIFNGTTLAGLGSLSTSAPTMPGGYTYKRLVGAMYYTASAFYKFQQYGEDVYYSNQGTFNTGNVLNAGSATSYTSVSLSSYVPPNASTSMLLVQTSAGSSGEPRDTTIYLSFDGVGDFLSLWFKALTSGGFYATDVVTMPLATAQTVWYYENHSGDNAYISVIGFSFNL